jgi:hypothetical protein
MRLKPFGSKLLVLPQERKNFITEGKIELIENELSEGLVIEVSDVFSDVIKEGDIVCYSAEAGKPQPYNGKSCIWIDARSINEGGDLWFVVVPDKIIQDKGDSL